MQEFLVIFFSVQIWSTKWGLSLQPFYIFLWELFIDLEYCELGYCLLCTAFVQGLKE